MAVYIGLADPEVHSGLLPRLERTRIAVLGLGYVGLPLAVEFGKVFPTTGFDINKRRVGELRSCRDRTRQVEDGDFIAARRLQLTHRLSGIRDSNVYVVSVPTPVDDCNRPDLSGLLYASECLGAMLEPGNVVIYESTVYPGATEEECVPVLERASGLVLNRDFFVGYSPERINPGDKEHRLTTIPKITSGSTPQAAAFVDALYRRIISAGTHKVSSIRVAEAAKVIENTQRDVNIALINELVMLFNHLGLDSREVLEAAETKWNFLKFRPGLVGGHCIGVDPYYLTHKAQSVGYHPEMILAGRRINDGMGRYVANQMVMAMLRHGIRINGARVLIMGATFKENCPDLRNTRVKDVVIELEAYGLAVDVHDPLADADEAREQFGDRFVRSPGKSAYDGIVVAVAHDRFRESGARTMRSYGKAEHVLYDLKCLLDRGEADVTL